LAEVVLSFFYDDHFNKKNSPEPFARKKKNKKKEKERKKTKKKETQT